MNILKTLLVLLLASGSILAQRSIYVNPKGGLNISGLNEELEGVTQTGKAGYNIGVDLRLGGGFAFFQPGMFYYQYNTKYEIVESSLLPNGETSYSSDVKVSSIKIPAQVGFRIFTTKPLSIRANLGPAVNFPVDVSSDDKLVLNRNHYENVTVGGVIGAGVDVLIFTFDINYEFGLSDYITFDDPNVDASSSNQYVLTFNVGIRL